MQNSRCRPPCPFPSQAASCPTRARRDWTAAARARIGTRLRLLAALPSGVLTPRGGCQNQAGMICLQLQASTPSSKSQRHKRSYSDRSRWQLLLPTSGRRYLSSRSQGSCAWVSIAYLIRCRWSYGSIRPSPPCH